jgi:hypothetical protein
MKKVMCIAAVLSMALTSCMVVAQAPASHMAQSPASNFGIQPITPTVPVDQQPTKEQLGKLMEAMHVREQMASMIRLMPQIVQQRIEQMTKDQPGMPQRTEEQKQASGQEWSKFMSTVMNLYTADEMIADMETVYQKHLTKQDVDGLIAFYDSAAGQHFVKEQPLIMQETMPLLMSRMQERIKPMIEQMNKEKGAINKSPMVPMLAAPSPAPPGK